MEEEVLMTPEEINQSYVTLTTRAKGPPSITVKVVHKNPHLAAVEASDIFDSLTKQYKAIFDAEQAPKIAAEDRLDPDYDPESTVAG